MYTTYLIENIFKSELTDVIHFIQALGKTLATIITFIIVDKFIDEEIWNFMCMNSSKFTCK